jgi:glucose uptake protein GlcU
MFGEGSDVDDGSSSGSTSSCEMCGWIAAAGGMLAFGSFGVPIKSKVAMSLNIDPLVMQSYKTAMCFVTSWLFVVLRGEECTFTPWGIVSGLFWVPGGIATIYAIKTAGLAIGIGVGSSFIVLVSFTWGIFVFGEHVHNRVQACFAVGCMLLGLCGMAYFSSPSVAHTTSSLGVDNSTNNNEMSSVRRNHDSTYYHPLRPEDPDFLRPDEEEDDVIRASHPPSSSLETDYVAMNDAAVDDTESNDAQDADSRNFVIAVEDTETNLDLDTHDTYTTNNIPATVLCCCGKLRIQERTLGILAALFVTGIWSGSMLVPMQFAPKQDKGLGFLISFAIGAAIVNLSFWLFRYIFLCCRHSSMTIAYQALPSFHLRKMWLYGASCGMLWSIGNFCSILAVEFLGEGVGYSATQASMLVSGLWGIFYFHEIEGVKAVVKWYFSAMVTVFGILLLSYEHHAK